MADHALWVPQSTADAPGLVQVQIAAAVALPQAWAALTDPEQVRCWFGDLAAPLQPDATVRLEFGDGDFFVLEQIALDAPYRLDYVWRFMGTGPRNWIGWTVEQTASGCQITVSDYDPDRSAGESATLVEGWEDFTQRLARFLQGEPNTRYDWRRELDVSIELPLALEAAWGCCFAAGQPARWLPLDGGNLAAGCRFLLHDGNEPAAPEIETVEWTGDGQVMLTIGHPAWQGHTQAVLTLAARPRGSIFSLSHTGWEAIGGASGEPLRQRRRFSLAWVAAVKALHALAESSVRLAKPQAHG